MNETSTSQKDESIQAALAAMKANRPLRAEEILRDYLHLNPGCVHHLRLLGHSLMKQKRLDEAEEQLRLALEIRPGFPHLNEDLGSVLAMQKRFEEAVPYFEKAVQLEPALPLAHKKLGQVLALLGRGEEADESFKEYLDQQPVKAEIAAGLELAPRHQYRTGLHGCLAQPGRSFTGQASTHGRHRVLPGSHPSRAQESRGLGRAG
jgi:tetratricopeptide (TPR) repeat protein